MKRLVGLGLSVFLFLSITSPTYALDFCPFGQFSKLCQLNPNDNSNLTGNIFSLLLIFAVLASIAFLIIGGIRWIIAGGDKAKIDAARSSITGAIIGLVISFSAFFIISLVNYFFGIDGLNNGTVFQLPTLSQDKNPGRGDLPTCDAYCSTKSDAAFNSCVSTNQGKNCRR